MPPTACPSMLGLTPATTHGHASHHQHQHTCRATARFVAIKKMPLVQYVESTEAEEAQRAAAAAALRRHQDLQALAAARIAQAAGRMVQRRRARQAAAMRPLLLDVGARVRVSFLQSSTVRMLVKISMVKAYSPTYTAEPYKVTARRLAPGSRRVVLYDVAVEDADLEEGEQGPTRIANLWVRLPLKLANVDRRYLQPVPAAGVTPTTARRFSQPLLLGLLPFAPPAAGESEDDEEDLYADLQSAVS